jgi:hypothetical protein
LGRAHAENDKDKLAILALEQAVAVDHGNLDALMTLAVSLVRFILFIIIYLLLFYY